MTLPLFFQVLALVLLLLAALGSHRAAAYPFVINLGWGGMFFWLLSLVLIR